jgi:preprotein translocase subunit YajC
MRWPNAVHASGRFCSSGTRSQPPNLMLYHLIALVNQGLLLAEDAAPQQDPNAFFKLMMPLVVITFLFYFIMIRPQKKKDDDFKRMVANLKENDHVVTAGGIYGVVTNVQRDAERVTIRVDESTGTKLRVSSSAITRVITDDADDAPATGAKQK